jgi:uncharacterized membrane protein
MFFSLFRVRYVRELFLLSSQSPLLIIFFASIYRADELETALMEMVKQDNRRELSAKVNNGIFMVAIFLIVSLIIIQLCFVPFIAEI